LEIIAITSASSSFKPQSLTKTKVEVKDISKTTQSSANVKSTKATFYPPEVIIIEVLAPRPVCSTGDNMDPGEEHW